MFAGVTLLKDANKILDCNLIPSEYYSPLLFLSLPLIHCRLQFPFVLSFACTFSTVAMFEKSLQVNGQAESRQA